MMVTMHENPDYLFEAVKAGAAGYVLKDASGERLLVVRRTLEGESPLNQELAMRLLKRLARESRGERRREGESGGTSREPPEDADESLTTHSVAARSGALQAGSGGSAQSRGAAQIESLTPKSKY